MSYVFGPVASRRLGRSLGVDLVPYKTCPYDCVYCQLGCTTKKTVERGEWTPIDTILGELAAKLPLKPDYITLGGSGEPTLTLGIGRLILEIKGMTDTPVAVLTNGALLWQPEVREELLDADLVCPSLDAGDEEAFQAVNRPHTDLSFAQMLDGLIEFRRQFRGQYWLEVLLVAGLTDTEEAVRKVAACARRIRPDRVQLNTVTRPPAESEVRGVGLEQMAAFAAMFDPPAEVVAEFRGQETRDARPVTREDVLDMVRRHPCSLEDIATGLGAARSLVSGHLEALLGAGALHQTAHEGIPQYRAWEETPRSE
jgi:wyosine [tRNA(Phe)-imidazoG37] synthetase (radical SAM superfamily)